MTIAQIMFLAFVGLTLLITFYAAKKNTGASAYFAAGRSITGWQNGLAVAGDYMSAASFLGISGAICFSGYDGFMYSVGFLVAYITVLLIVAEPLRNAGKYTMADLLAYRLKPRPVRALASLSTLTVSTIYMIAQMVGAGGIIERLINIQFAPAVIGVGVLMLVYVVFGGMLATTWVQIIKALLLIAGALLLSYLVLQHHHFSFAEFFSSVSKADYGGTSEPKNLMQPGLKYGVAAAGPWGPLDLISLCLGLVLGTAGLPHILVRFYTVPDAKTARSSVVWAMAIIGLFYIMTTFFGFGAATILKKELITTAAGKPDINMVAPILARHLGGEYFFAFISAVAFATILAVVAGLTMSASASFAHDFYSNVIHHGKENRPGAELKVARLTAFCVGAVSIGIAIFLGPSVNTAFLVGLAFAVAASANLPVIIFSVFWKRFNTAGAVAGLSVGLLSSIILILLSPNGVFGKAGAIFPLENPGIVSIPIGFLAAYLGTILTPRDLEAEAKFAELTVRAHTGLGAEKATAH
ncbi:solute symporter family protein [Prosthecobacter vanneervenii]|uniref:Cation/acetate symporter n=1 Tax=Prosthecobacter vanneervenii TaxID=48466 RepID=A0A7W7YEC3_9BACT|nr:cation acetate symporter [Prosthecobacter vanneervenii]MBB5034618.1 cation/acetate symporter [Prosthecobacter vanneervenii]